MDLHIVEEDFRIRQDYIFELDYFQNRNFNSYILRKIAKEHNNQILTGYQCFINNLPTSLEFYVFLSYKSTSKSEIERMKELLFPISNYRPDVSLNTLFNRIGD
ncbi:hypothetical protein V7147_22130, partial [Bacillus sp. JJ1521]|uniref:hypothetical protein n=1 Tax=Bacillus sp. JJ1521 TaxID=3122957 RepID=UPI003000AF34